MIFSELRVGQMFRVACNPFFYMKTLPVIYNDGHGDFSVNAVSNPDGRDHVCVLFYEQEEVIPHDTRAGVQAGV
jgi:hypothetical protein